MSRYLVDRIESMDNVTDLGSTPMSSASMAMVTCGAVTMKSKDGAEETITTSALFLFIGADPNTTWLRGCVELDKRGSC